VFKRWWSQALAAVAGYVVLTGVARLLSSLGVAYLRTFQAVCLVALVVTGWIWVRRLRRQQRQGVRQ
jgi:heme A synthase